MKAAAKTHPVLNGIPKEQLAEAAHITAETLGLITLDNQLILGDGKSEAYGSPEHAQNALEFRIARAQLAFLVKRHGRCSHKKYESRGMSIECHRPVVEEIKRQGGKTSLCAIHLRTYRAAQTKRASRSEETRAEFKESKEAEKRAQALAERAGVPLSRQYRRMGQLSKRDVVISMDDLEKLLDRLGG